MSKATRKVKASLSEVAQAAGVSKMTASRVLRNASGFSEETRVRVMREVERLGYVPNRLAVAFGSDNASTLVGVCVPRLTSSLFGELLESIHARLSNLSFQSMIGVHEDVPETEEAWLRNFLSWRPAGVILSGRMHTPAAIDLLKASSIPVVEMWELNTSPLDVSVGFNHFDCGYQMGQHLIARGRRRIGIVGAITGKAAPASGRFDGFRAALSAAGLSVVETEIVNDRAATYPGYYGTETLLARAPGLDAIYYHNDAMAIGGLHYCQAKGIKVREEISIAGWGGMEAASVLPMRLTTTAISTESIGRAAAEALVARVRNEPCQDVIVIPTRLLPGSTA